MFIYLGSKGKGFFMNQEMSVYRIHRDGVFSHTRAEKKSSDLVEFYYSNIINYLIINRNLGYRYKDIVFDVVLFRSELIQASQSQNRTKHFLKLLRIISDYFEIKLLSFFLTFI